MWHVVIKSGQFTGDYTFKSAVTAWNFFQYARKLFTVEFPVTE